MSSHPTPTSTMSPTPLRLTLIAAVSPTNGLGKSGGLPWRLPKEMSYFRRVTSSLPPHDPSTSVGQREGKNAVLMGRNTWNSIPNKFRPLTGRVNVVVSSIAQPRLELGEDDKMARERAQKELGIDPSNDAHVFPDLSSAASFLSSPSSSVSRTFLIGGAQLYAQALREMVPPSSSISTASSSTPQSTTNTTTITSKSESEANVVLDRLLITRIFETGYEECDVFLPEFRSREEVVKDSERGGARGGVESDSNSTSTPNGGSEDSEGVKRDWKRSEASELRAWIGEEEPGESLVGQIVEEKGARYEFQMWVRP